jgi:hypothetical protein
MMLSTPSPQGPPYVRAYACMFVRLQCVEWGARGCFFHGENVKLQFAIDVGLLIRFGIICDILEVKFL